MTINSPLRYQITLQNSSNIQVGLPRATSRRLVDVDLLQLDVKGNLADLQDIDPANRQEGYVLMWNAATSKHEYVPPFVVVDRADSALGQPVAPADDYIDYGSF
jgi:hypothetical protein